MNARRIEGAVALVTGANRGIGRALTEALLSRGARKVYATARNPEALSALRALWNDRLVPLRLDVTDVAQIRAAAEAAPDVELVFNNAGVSLARGIAGSTLLTNIPFFPTYSASKAALHSLTQAARLLLGEQGTSVFGVYAGPIDTDMAREVELPKRFESSPKDLEREMSAMAAAMLSRSAA